MPLKIKSQFGTKNDNLEHERLLSLINSMADAVIAVDEKVDIVAYNSAALNILDVNNIVLHTPLKKLFNPVDKNDQVADIEEMITSSKTPVTNRDLLLSYKDSSKINLYISIAPVHLGYGIRGLRGYVLLLRDITREKSLEEERDEFISVVSHELRTPITIAEGNLSNAKFIANKTADINKIKQGLDEAHKQVLFLADMINDLSTLSRAERGVLQIDVEEIKPTELIDELVKSYTPEAAAKGLALKSVIDPKINNLFSSRLYVREIMQNFITNALKYTSKGEIVVHGENCDNGICLSVHDTGIGISKADQERVFDKFFRSEDYRTREASGTGLGLYVTLKLIHLVKARVTLDSQLNHGSTFSVFIPSLKQQKPKTPTEHA
jgi:signal transduction histidine kinase